jgi:hypothetical protein
MAGTERLQSSDAEPEGVAAEGMESYPTYRDGPVSPHVATTTKPTDVGLPRSERTNQTPILIGLVAFVLVVVGLIAWATLRTASTPEGLTPPETPSTLDSATSPDSGSVRDATEPAAEAGPGDVEAVPGSVDVPGGDATTPVAPEPAQ